MLKPEELRNEEFEISVLGGYKRETVDGFIKVVAADYEKLYNENAELVQKLKVCVGKIEEYRKDEQFLKSAIINAEKLNETTLKDIENREKEIEKTAKENAESIIAQAKDDAENIVRRAKADSEESIRAYQISADRKIGEIQSKIQSEEKKLELIKKEVSDFKDSLFKIYKQHLSSISKLPSVSKERKIHDIDEEHNVQEEAELNANEHEAENKTAVNIPVEASNDHEDNKASEKSDAAAEKVPVYAGKTEGSDKTAEFVIEKKQKPSEDNRLHEMFDNSFKFKDLKFGTDFDLNKDE